MSFYSKLNATTFALAGMQPLDIVVGDEKQKDFYPRVKFKKWDNDANLSIGVQHGTQGADIKATNKLITWQKGNLHARFYDKSPNGYSEPNTLRYINMGLVAPEFAAASFELDVHCKFTSPTITILQLQSPAVVYYGLTPRKEYFHSKAMNIPEIRILATTFDNAPMYLDSSVLIFTIYYRRNQGEDPKEIINSALTSLKTVFKKSGIDVVTKSNDPNKLFFQYKNQLVKFVSVNALDGRCTFYVNLDCDYNKIFDAIDKASKQKLGNIVPAFGIKKIYPHLSEDIGHAFVVEYTRQRKLKIKKSQFTSSEHMIINDLQNVHTSKAWVNNVTRSDVYSYCSEEGDEDEFEFDLVLLKKPKKNVVQMTIETKNLEFLYQGKLTQDEIAQKSIRPPRVVGSYAVYHSDPDPYKHSNAKAFHIYRPIIIDAAGKRVWGDMTINLDKKRLDITIPQDFIDTAIYPVVVDPTLGYTTKGTSSTAFDSAIIGVPYQMPPGLIATSIDLPLSSDYANTNAQAQGAIYSETSGSRVALTLVDDRSGTGNLYNGSTYQFLFSPAVSLGASDRRIIAFSGCDIFTGGGGGC